MQAAALDAWFDVFESEQARYHPFLDEPGRRERIELALLQEREQRSSGLKGLLFGVKDLINVEGLDTRAGSNLPSSVFVGSEATMVSRLQDHGAVVAGKTTTTEFAFSEPSETRNPRAPAHTPGGSSSGSAAAVAAGMVPFALGTQTVDSIVTPAAYCGVVGFKPTYGRVPLDGVVPFSPAMDHGGVLASDVATTQLVAGAICDVWENPKCPTDRVIGLPGAAYLQRADTEARQNLDEVVAKLKATGFDFVETDVLDDIEEIENHHRHLIAAEFVRLSRRLFEGYGQLLRPRTHEIYELGMSQGDSAIEMGREHSTILRDRLMTTMVRLGLTAWVAPSATGYPPFGLDDIGDPVMGRPWTHAHLPVVALPTTEIGTLPLGVQFIGRHGLDEDLLTLAVEVERIL